MKLVRFECEDGEVVGHVKFPEGFMPSYVVWFSRVFHVKLLGGEVIYSEVDAHAIEEKEML